MSRINMPFDQYGGTGWALFDWEYNLNRPTLSFIAGNMHALRLQFDAYRRELQMPYDTLQIQFWIWSQNDYRFYVSHRYVEGFNPNTLYPQAYPTQEDLVTTATIREYRGTAPSGSYQNHLVTTSSQTTIANRFFGIYDITFPGPIGALTVQAWIEQPGTKSKVRVLAIGHHNSNFENGY